MEARFDGKLAVVTGGAGGMGSVVCKTLLESGASVAVVDSSQAAIDAVLPTLEPL